MHPNRYWILFYMSPFLTENELHSAGAQWSPVSGHVGLARDSVENQKGVIGDTAL